MNKTRESEEQSIRDFGPQPFAVNIDRLSIANPNYRFALWTGSHLQVTLMSIAPGGDIGLEIHPEFDQLLYITQGNAFVQMGREREGMQMKWKVQSGDAVIIPAATWHNLVNTGRVPVKLFSVYAPPVHPRGTVHDTRDIAEQGEHA